MCTVNCLQWVAKNLTISEVKGKRVIEVGSREVNGSLRYMIEMLEPSEYVGIDFEPGKGVDVVCRAEELVERFGKESFDIVVSSNLLEHVRDWRAVVSNMKNICRPSGFIVIETPSRWPFHGYPYDFWRYHEEDMRNIFQDCEIVEIYEETDKKKTMTYVKIRKPANFREAELSDIQLYSIITNKRQGTITDRELSSWRFKLKVWQYKVYIWCLGKWRGETYQ